LENIHCRRDCGINRTIDIQGRHLIYEVNLEKGTPFYREMKKMVQVQEGNVYDESPAALRIAYLLKRGITI
jgi:hypothetical protein